MKTYVKTTPKQEREQVARLAGTTDAYFQQLAGGHRSPSKKLAERLEKATNGKLNKIMLLFPPKAETPITTDQLSSLAGNDPTTMNSTPSAQPRNPADYLSRTTYV